MSAAERAESMREISQRQQRREAWARARRRDLEVRATDLGMRVAWSVPDIDISRILAQRGEA